VSDETDISPEEYAAARHYAMIIEWSEEDGVFVVTVPDIPRCRTHGATRGEAAAMGDEAIALVIASRASRHEPMPRPRFTALRNEIVVDSERVRRVRRKLAVSQREFANLLNVSVSAVRAWEQGLRTPDGASARLLEIAEHHPEVLLDVA
jgi:DNA-binding transcriptional regulator YiaG